MRLDSGVSEPLEDERQIRSFNLPHTLSDVMSQTDGYETIRSRVSKELDISEDLVTEDKLLGLIGESFLGAADGEEAVDVHRCSEYLELLAEQQDNEHIQFQAHILRTIIDDMWDNIAMESSMRISDEVIDEVLESIGEHIVQISKMYESENYVLCYSYFAILYDDYLNHIDKMNTDVKEGSKGRVSR